MPSTAESPARSTRRNITGVIARHSAGCVDVCKQDDKVSLHFSTQQGVVILTVDLKEFTFKCRGRLDHNLNPLPSIADYAPIAEPALPPVRVDRRRKRGMDPDLLARFQLALAGYLKGTFRTKSAAANFYQIGHLYQTFVNWTRLQGSAKPAVPLTDGERPFILKPGGKRL